MAKMTYLGHGSLRFITDCGKVIYVDPYWGEDYSMPANLILVTHQHGDHNQVDKVTKAQDCRIITEVDALLGDKHNSFDLGFVLVDSVTAENKNHNPKETVGYIIHFGDISVYCAGDTSMTDDMKCMKNIDYALLPIDGIYNMDALEASNCAELINARHTIPIHTDPSGYLLDKVATFVHRSKLVVEPGETIELN